MTMTSAPDFEETRAVAQSTGDVTLPPGTRLRDYEITRVIAEGAFGIVYLARDHSLHRQVAVKEYFPASIATRADDSAAVVTADRLLDTFRTGLASFVGEARQLAGFDHPSLLKVYRFWEDNGTAYRAMPYLEGPSLRAALVGLGHVPSEAELRVWFKPLLDAVTALHAGRVWHQNISPDSILITANGPVLLGFASAAHAIEAIHHTPAAALCPGFAAIEQYGSVAGTTRGPWTDLYALGATVYAAVTGADPAPAANRLARDDVRPLSVVAAGLYSPGLLAAIDAAMAIQPQQRPADHAEFRALMGAIEAPTTLLLSPRRDLMQEPFLPAPDEDREVTVPDPPRIAATEPVAAAPLPERAPASAVPPAARPAPKVAPVAGDGADRSLPSWMTNGVQPASGRRVLYGVVAGACTLIGIAALAFQFTSRSAPRAALATVSAPASAVASPAPPAQSSAPVAVAAPTALAVATPAPAAVASAPPVPTPLPTPTPAPRPSAVVPAPAPVPVATAAPADPHARSSRCLDILQKASLEQITATETEFFKKECK